MSEMTEVPSGPSQGLLSFYDRLRRRILRFIERRGHRLEGGVVNALLLVPDVFMLLVRLSIDRQVPAATRSLIGGTLLYFLLPADLLPEMTVGPVGFVEDLVLATLVLSQALDRDLEPVAARHWSGSQELRVALRDVTQAGALLLGDSLYSRLRDLLARRGIDLGAAKPGAAGSTRALTGDQ